MKKIILTSFIIVGSIISSFAQSGQKWATDGNSNSTGDFLGTTNNFPLDFKTNNVLKMSLGTNGVLKINNLAGTGSRLLQADANGNIIQLPQGSIGQYLSYDGTWQNMPKGNWLNTGNDVYWTAGNVGIGIAPSPIFKLDVVGDARISNNLYVGGGIVITDKVHAATQIKGFDFKVDNDLSVEASTRLKGTTRIDQGFTFDGTRGITYTPSNGSISAKFHYGNNVAGIPESCAAAPQAWANHQFGGILQIYDADPNTGAYISNSGLLNIQTWTGGSSIDASVGGETNQGGLLLNYFCGNNTFINTGEYGGIVTLGKTVVQTPDVEAFELKDMNNAVQFKIKNTGFVYAREINVQLGSFPDYVFKKDYELTPLEDVEKYINSNHHLKGFEMAAFYEKDGMNLSEIVVKQQEKIEELTLYLIELKKEIENLKSK